MRVAHIDTEQGWRGGQNQVRLLVEGMRQQGVWTGLVIGENSGHLTQQTASDARLVLKNKGRNVSSIRRLKEWIHQYQVDLLDCHSSHAHDIGLLLKFFHPELKLVIHRRVDYRPQNNWLQRLKYHSGAINHYVAISNFIARVMLDYGVDPKRISTVRSAVHNSLTTESEPEQRSKIRQKIAKELQIDPDAWWLISTSALTPQKGHHYFLKSLALVLSKHPGTKVLIAGTGELQSSLHLEATALGIQNSIIWLGYRQDIPELLLAGDLFVISSVDEGLGTSVLEAMHQNIPIVATDAGGIPEMVINNQTGKLIPKKNSEALANAIIEMIEQPEQGRILSAGAIETTLPKFTVQNMVTGNLAVYEKILAAP
jgi:L-malate glycosyltransferase